MMIHRSVVIAALALALPMGLAAEDLGLPPGLDSGYGAQSQADQLVKLQARVDELLQQAKAVREGEDRLTGQIDRLMNATGVRFGGEAVAHSISYTKFPTWGSTPGATTKNERQWPSVGYFDFVIHAQPRPELSAEVVYRMEKVFGGYWGSLDISGVKRFNIHGDTPIGFDAGIFNYKHSPLTVWAPEDVFPFETEILARKRREGMKQMDLGGNAWPLQGLRADATIVFFKHLDLEIESIGVRTAIAGTKNTGLGFSVLYPYDQYLFGYTAAFTGEEMKMLRLGFSRFEFIESVDTAITPSTAGQLRNDITAADLTFETPSKAIRFKVEGASSNYNHTYGKDLTYTSSPQGSWISGAAAYGLFDVTTKPFFMKLHGLYVAESFINPAAQTRTHYSLADAQGSIPTANNLYDPHEGDYGLNTVPYAYQTRFNNVIFATNQFPALKNGRQAGTKLIPPGDRGRVLPYGWATPNRVGGGADLGFSILGGGLQPRLLASTYMEPETAYYVPVSNGARTYSELGGGLKIDLAPWTGLALDFGGGWVVEDIKSVGNIASYTVQTGDFGFHWQVFKTLHLNLGWEQVCAYGQDYQFTNTGAGAAGLFTLNNVATVTGGGLNWAISKSTDAYLAYSHLDQWSPKTPVFSWGAEEIEAKLALRF